MMFGFSQSVHRGAPNFTTEVQILVPEPYMGTIIGSGGQKIKAQRKVISIHSKENHVLVLSFIGIKCSHKGMHYQLYICCKSILWSRYLVTRYLDPMREVFQLLVERLPFCLSSPMCLLN